MVQVAGYTGGSGSFQQQQLITTKVGNLTPTEARLAELWTAMLGVSAVGPRDDFFALGGDSLLAAELQIEIELAFGVEVPATTLFRTPTIADLAQVVESATGSAAMRADR